MKKLGLFLSLLICSTLVAGCGNNKQALPENPIIFNETEIDGHWAIENDGKYYFAYSTIKPKGVIGDFNYAFGDCLGYVGDDSNDRIYELSGESSDEWLIKYYVNGEMETPTILREITIKDEKYIPESVEGAPEEDVRFPDSNPIYGGIGTHEIVGDKTIYYNDEYGISLRVREDFSGGMVQELNTTEALYEHEYLAHYISFSIRNDDIPEMYKIDGKGYEQNFLIVAYDNEEIEKWNLNSRFGNPEYYEILGKNNKYTFIITPKNKNYTDLYIFDVKESGDNQFLEDIKSSGEQPQGKNILITIEDEMDMNINLQIGNKTFDVVLEDNIATKALIEKLHEGDIVVNAREYGGFEKVGSLGFDLPRADKQISTEPGDLVLYQGNQVSLFYNSNSRSYTKLGKVQMNSEEDLEKILGNGDVTLTFSLK